MNEDKLKLFVNELNYKKQVSFYLFNVKYIITYEEKRYKIKQENL